MKALEWGGHYPLPYCWVGPVLFTWEHGRPLSLRASWNPD